MLFEFFYQQFPDIAGLLVQLCECIWTMLEVSFPQWEETLNLFYELFMQF